MKYIYVVIIPLLLLSIYGSCGGSQNNGTETEDCLDASSNSSILEENMDCPADAVVQICTGFICDIESTSQNNPFAVSSNLSFSPSNCESSSCFEFTCEGTITDTELGMINEVPVKGDYSIDTVFGNVITGTVFLSNEETQEIVEFSFSCSPFVI